MANGDVHIPEVAGAETNPAELIGREIKTIGRRARLAQLLACVALIIALVMALLINRPTDQKADDAINDADAAQSKSIAANRKAIVSLQVGLTAARRSLGNTRYLQGEQARPGLSGAPGALGPRGLAGRPGGLGAAGVDGVDGAPGESVQGPPGESVEGPAGVDGKDGAKGDPGESVQGPAGADGAPGATGAQGPPVGSFTFTDSTGNTQSCSDPEGDGSYGCSVVLP